MPKGYKLIFSSDEIAEIRRLYHEEKLFISRIAERFGVSYTGIRNAMIKAGIERRQARRKYYVNEHAFDEMDNEHAAYHLGFIYADGCVSKTFLQIALHPKDRIQLERLRDFLKSDSPIHTYIYDSPKASLAVSGIHLSNRLRELGILAGRPNHDLCLNEIPRELQHHWLRGFFNGDGSATKGHRIVFCGSYELMIWIRAFLAREAGRNPELGIITHCSGLRYLSYGRAPSARKVAECMYKDATVWLERKRDIIDSWPQPISRSERTKKGWVTRKRNLEKRG